MICVGGVDDAQHTSSFPVILIDLVGLSDLKVFDVRDALYDSFECFMKEKL